jgi:hypothetical protein
LARGEFSDLRGKVVDVSVGGVERQVVTTTGDLSPRND